MRDKLQLVETIKKYIKEPYQGKLVNDIRPSIRLRTTTVRHPNAGQTKFGGIPDLPNGISWPSCEIDGLPYSFLAQINLKDVADFDVEKQLPAEGMIYFFFNLNSGDEGKVIYSPSDNLLYKAELPEQFTLENQTFLKRLFSKKKHTKILTERAVNISTEYFIPSWDSLHAEKIFKETSTDLKPIDAFEGADDYYDSIHDGESENVSNHHLLGYYNGIQNEFHELNLLDANDIEDADGMEMLTLDVINKALEWTLLFQMDSDENLNLNIGDSGRVYFFISKNDLKKKNFTKVRITADCY